MLTAFVITCILFSNFFIRTSTSHYPGTAEVGQINALLTVSSALCDKHCLTTWKKSILILLPN